MLWFHGHQNLYNELVRSRVQVWVLVWAPTSHLAISLKAVPEGNQRFRGQNHWQLSSSWGSSPALLALVQVGQASTNTVCFQVSCSSCWPLQATTLAILTQFKSQQGLILCKCWAATTRLTLAKLHVLVLTSFIKLIKLLQNLMKLLPNHIMVW